VRVLTAPLNIMSYFSNGSMVRFKKTDVGDVGRQGRHNVQKAAPKTTSAHGCICYFFEYSIECFDECRRRAMLLVMPTGGVYKGVMTSAEIAMGNAASA
jgi:hypothetical protein